MCAVQLDSQVEEALRVAVKRSMAEMAKAFAGAHKQEPLPLFNTELQLDSGGHVEVSPTIQVMLHAGIV